VYAAVCDGGVVECISVFQIPKIGVTHVAAVSSKASEYETHSTKLHYFMLPSDIAYSKYQLPMSRDI